MAESGLVPGPDAGAPDDVCVGCQGTLRWIDAAFACPNGCAVCAECGDGTAGSCPSCGEPLRRRASRARPLPGR